MNINIKKIAHLFVISLSIICMQSLHAQPIMVPGFMGIESSYIEAPEEGSDSTTAYFTISNFHYEPILILSANGDSFESAALNNADHGTVESILIEPGQRLVMQPGGFHVHLSEIDATMFDEDSYDITLLVRRGLEPMEEVEAVQELGAMSGVRSREAGIPNEQEFVVNSPVKH
jgi:copper(I)-binding protein